MSSSRLRLARAGWRGLSSLGFTSSGGEIAATRTAIPEKVGEKDIQVAFLACAVSGYDKVADGKIIGSSGVGVVEKTGAKVKSPKKGDLVVPIKAGMGTWREVGVLPAAQVAVVPPAMKMEHAATLWSGPLTALKVMNDFKPAKGVVINGAETPVGQALVQLAALNGLSTVCVVNDNLPSFAPVVEGLKYLGASVVVAESYPAAQLKALVKDLGSFDLGVDISGQSSVKFMQDLTKKVVTLTDFVKGKAAGSTTFSLADWFDKASSKDAQSLVNEVAELQSSGKLITLSKKVPLNGLVAALNAAEPMPLRTLIGVTGAKA